MKVVVVKGSKFWGFILRKMFHIKKANGRRSRWLFSCKKQMDSPPIV